MEAILKVCKENPTLMVVIAGLIIFLLILLFITLSLAKKAKMAKEQLALMEAEKERAIQKKPATKKTPATKQEKPKATEKKTPQKKTAEKKTAEKKIPAKASPTAKIKTKKTLKEEDMLLDELKDVDNEIDFYEEDETDRVARYSGKWVICRVITDDKAAPEEEMYFFELHASNGEKLLSSEEYTSYAGALRGI